jgi:hypothetical protein
VNPRVGSRVLGRSDGIGGGADGRRVAVVAGSGLFSLLDLLEVDLVAEPFELALESAGAMPWRVRPERRRLANS